jgi:aspartate dehydrogenase
MVRVGLVGCGTIGAQLARALQRNYPHAAKLVALHDVDRAHAAALKRRLRGDPPIVSLPALIRMADLVIEAASADVAGEVVRRSLRAGRSVFVMSVGGLLRDRTWQRLARRSRARVHIPSGALAGLDGVKALAVGTIRSVSLTTRKPPRAFLAAHGARRSRLPAGRLTRPSVLLEGSPAAVVKAFPQNTNVAAALLLASGAPPSRMRVRVVADPTIRVNVHEVEVRGDCGRIRCTIQSRPSTNPKTSELAVRSAIATLGRLFDRVVIGT